MKLRILGNNGPFPSVGGACSSYLLQAGELKILIDMGNGSLAELQKYCSLFDVDVIILSHFHFDHISDFLVYKYAVKDKKTSKKQIVFMPGSPENIFNIANDARFDVNVIKDGMKCVISGARFSFIKVKHPVECYAVVIEYGNSKFVYTADTFDSSPLKKEIQGAKLLLADACLLERDKTEGSLHFSVKEACELGKTASKTVLTHLSPVYSGEEILSEVCFNAVLSKKGDEYQF